MKKLPIPAKRVLNLAGFAICAGLMGFALFAQHVLLLEPCPLCIFQRIAVIGLGVLFLIAALHNSTGFGRYVYSGLILIVALAGAAVARQHAWLQKHPEELPQSCGPGLDYMWQEFPFADVINLVFQGSGECTQIVWQFLGLTMPGWVLLWIAGLGIAGIWNNLRQ